MRQRISTRIGAELAAIAIVWGAAAGAAAQGLESESGPLPTLEITPGEVKAFRAAVLRFVEVGPPVGAERVGALRDEIDRGLVFSSVVVPLGREAYLVPETSAPLAQANLDCATWKQSGADAVVQGEMKREDTRLRADLRILDVARCRELKTGRVVGDRNDLAKLGRMIADQIVEALTGTRGVSATEVAFISDRTGKRELYVMSADGRNARPATNVNSLKMFPEWMPDGSAILYIAYAKNQPGLFLTSRSPLIKPGPILQSLFTGRPVYRGRFDPTGEELAVVSSVEGAAEIFLVKRQGSQPRRLTNHPAIDITPSFSPDGRQIAFVSDRSGSPQLYLMNRDGSNLTRLTFTGSYNAAPIWSPDGRWIAYETRVRGQFDIWLVDPSGQINFPVIQHPRSDEGPTWSPDGRKLAFSSSRRGRYDIYVSDWNGENVLRVTEGQGSNIQPAWGPQPR
jgi:TolB protein